MNAFLLLLLGATIPIRNPFWPINHRGTPEIITDEPRVEIKAAVEAETDDTRAAVNAESIADANAAKAAEAAVGGGDERLWIAARKALKISGAHMRGEKRQTIVINGNIYADGDTLRAVHDGCEFFWRVRRVSEHGMLTLKRLTFRELPETESNGKGNPQ